MKKSIIYVQFPNRPVPRESNTKHNPYGSQLYNRAEGLRKIDTGTLVEAFGDEPCFVGLNKPVGIPFNPKNPLAINMEIPMKPHSSEGQQNACN